MFNNLSTPETETEKTIRATLYLQLVNELENAQSTLKEEHEIYELYTFNGSVGQKRFFCTFDFYTDYLTLDEFESLVNECKDMNERDLIF
tara:strand:+ start:488 stop:757 length:270 start_codon:yes stop_codon:yes gene_type:complete